MTTLVQQKQTRAESLLFDHLILRLIVGVIAMGFPLAVYIFALTVTSSISASYYTDARDVFVGLLFIIGALFLAYRGHSIPEGRISKIGALAAFSAAIFPTACDECSADVKSTLHLVSAFILFSTIVYFCLVAFRGSVKDKIAEETKKVEKLQQQGGKVAQAEIQRLQALQIKQRRRLRFYSICGWSIAAIMLGSLSAPLVLSMEIRSALPILFIAESAALELFGMAWLAASKAVPYLAHDDERLYLFKRIERPEGVVKNV